MNDIMRRCKIHGDTLHSTGKDGYARCKKCSSEQVSRRRKKLKLLAIEYMGYKCARCGLSFPDYPEVMEFHHRDPTKKDFGIASNGHTRAINKIKSELDKCDMYCSNCHRIVHADLKNNGA